jgi:hypothetical protein
MEGVLNTTTPSAEQFMKYRYATLLFLLSFVLTGVLPNALRAAEPAAVSTIRFQEVRAGDVKNETLVEETDGTCAILPLTRFNNLLNDRIPIGFAQGEGSLCSVGESLFDLQIKAFEEASTDMARLTGTHIVHFYVAPGDSGLPAGDPAELELVYSLNGSTSVTGVVPGQDSAQIQLKGTVLQQPEGAEAITWGSSIVSFAEISGGGTAKITYGQAVDSGVTTDLLFAGGAFDSGTRTHSFTVPVGEGLRFEVVLDAKAIDSNRGRSSIDFQDTASMRLQAGAANPGIELVPGAIPVPEPGITALLLLGLLTAFFRLARR